jgi:hypothetical protein
VVETAGSCDRRFVILAGFGNENNEDLSSLLSLEPPLV